MYTKFIQSTQSATGYPNNDAVLAAAGGEAHARSETECC